ncbi:MAG TPA: hypothetical protein VMV79_04430, partial [Alphaproteobacteria bacterium]|nr:hypothetical protein [Alphaproteobacteria bacterium]
MSSRRLHASHRPEFFGGLRLIFAYFIVWLENILDIYARPLMLIGFFAALAWLGFFRVLYPWAHLVALGAFTLVFFEAL